MPSTEPSDMPSYSPSIAPTSDPSQITSSDPSHDPSTMPSVVPSLSPSTNPTCDPSSIPSGLPSRDPFEMPSNKPTSDPSQITSSDPSHYPSSMPSVVPSLSQSGPHLLRDMFILEKRQNESFESFNKIRVRGPNGNGKNRAVAIVDFLVSPTFSPSAGACLSFMVAEPITKASTLQLLQLDHPLPPVDEVTWNNTFMDVENANPISARVIDPSFRPQDLIFFDVSSSVVSEVDRLTFAVISTERKFIGKFFANDTENVNSAPALLMEDDCPFEQPLDSSIEPSMQPSSMPSGSPTILTSTDRSVNPSSVPSSVPSLSSLPSFVSSEEPTVCVDEHPWEVGGSSDFAGLTCEDIDNNYVLGWCNLIMEIDDGTFKGKVINEACCECGGSAFKPVAPSTLPSLSPSSVPSSSPTICTDDDDWSIVVNGETVTCDWLTNQNLCNAVSTFYSNSKNAYSACCLCEEPPP